MSVDWFALGDGGGGEVCLMMCFWGVWERIVCGYFEREDVGLWKTYWLPDAESVPR